MAFDTEMAMPSYIIYRDIPAGQPMDLNAPLAFFPPKDSDELFDALRMKYPNLKSHSERTGQAVIEYLLEEAQVPQMPVEQLPTPQTAASVNVSPWEASMQSMSSDASEWSSPEMFGLATPIFGNSPQPLHSHPLLRQHSTATSTVDSSQPALENMTGVFSLSDSTQPKQRVRRKMTEAEKIEYRKRRIVKACEKCAKRKRKCVHNQPEMENMAATKTKKVGKPTPSGPMKRPAQQNQQQQQQPQQTSMTSDLSSFDHSFMTDVSMPSFDDFAMLPDSPVLDDFLDAETSQLPWSPNLDWTLFEPTNTNFQTTPHKTEFEHLHDLARHQPNYNDSLLWEHLQPDLVEQPQEEQQPTHTRHLHEEIVEEPCDLDNLDYIRWNHGLLNAGGRSPWDKSRPIEQPSTNIQHVQRPQHLPSENTAEDNRHCPQSLAQMTLRLTGTRKAVEAFGNLLPARSSSRSSLENVSLRKVAIVALGSLSMAQQLQGGMEMRGQIDSIRPPNLSAVCPIHSGGRFEYTDDLRRHVNNHHQPIFAIDEGETMNMNRAHRRRPLRSRGDTGSGDNTRSHTTTSRYRSLGEGVATMKDPTTELYMLKRRIAHSPLERSNPLGAHNPLLTTIPALLEEGTLRGNAPQAISAKVNGGAYRRLDSSPHNKPLPNDANANAAAAMPVHSRPHTASASVAIAATAAGASATVDFAYSAFTRNEKAQERLSDHVRRRDHFGRPAAPSALVRSAGAFATVAVLGLLLFLVSLLPSGSSSTSSLGLFILALATPVSKDTTRIHTSRTPSSTQLWGTSVQLAVWNTSWSNEDDHSDVDARLFASVQKRLGRFLYRACRRGSGRTRINSIGKKAI